MYGALSNSGDSSYSSSDVALYNYNHEAATTISLVGNATQGTSNDTWDETWNAGTTVHKWWVAATGDHRNHTGDVIHDNGGKSIHLASVDYSWTYGTLDALDQGTVGEGETLTNNNDVANTADVGKQYSLVLWG
jgi:hypothetical protein